MADEQENLGFPQDDEGDESSAASVAETPVAEGTETAAPVEAVPSVPPAPVAPPAPAYSPDQVAQIQAYAQQMAQRNQQYEQAAQAKQVEEHFRAQEQQLINMGASPEQAASMVGVIRQPYEQLRQSQQQVNYLTQQQASISQGAQAKMEMILQLADKYKVAPRDLVNYNTPQAMEAAAAQSQKISALENQISQLRQGRVPAQSMENGQGAGATASSLDALEQLLGNPDYVPTVKELERYNELTST